jgi:hypothetical protein
MERVWPQTVVVEANLNVNIAALRRALGDGHDGNRYLVTIPGRGYGFVASVTFSDFNHQDPAALRPSNDLPTQSTRLFGEDEIVKQLAGELRQHGFITIAGPGGVGKSSVAHAVAAELTGNYQHGFFWVDLTSIETPGLVPNKVADVLGVETRPEDVRPSGQAERQGCAAGARQLRAPSRRRRRLDDRLAEDCSRFADSDY